MTIQQIKLQIPNSWEDITLQEYVKLVNLGNVSNLDDAKSILEYKLNQIHILNPDIDLETLKLLTLSQLKEYFTQIEFLNSQPVLRDCKTLTIEDKVYTFQDPKLMSLEQWIDAEKYSSLENAHKLIAIFYIPAIEYNNSELDKVSEYLLKAPATEYFWSASFFLFMHKTLELAINRYSEILQKSQRIIHNAEKVQIFKNKVLSKLGFE